MKQSISISNSLRAVLFIFVKTAVVSVLQSCVCPLGSSGLQVAVLAAERSPAACLTSSMLVVCSGHSSMTSNNVFESVCCFWVILLAGFQI